MQIALLSGAVPRAEYRLVKNHLLALWKTASGHINLKATCLQRGKDTGAEETSGAGHEHTPHGIQSGNWRSRSAMMAMGSGQVMRREGSFHRIPSLCQAERRIDHIKHLGCIFQNLKSMRET